MKKPILLFPFIAALSSCALFPSGNGSSSFSSSKEPSSSQDPGTTNDGSSESEASSGAPVLEDYHPEGYSLAWSDEFEGSVLSKANWSYEIGSNNGWGNNELEYYTDHNETVADGLLTITAKAEKTVDGDKTFDYTSSRLVTRGKAYFTYGYMCARIRLPLGDGMWPAFWMMPEKNYEGEGHTWWPTPGEIDIMEAKGRLRNNAAGALHYSANGTGGAHTYQAKDYGSIGNIDDFHVYAVKWTDQEITWIYDGTPFFVVQKSTWNRGYGKSDATPFNKDFYFILNLAVGGNYDGGIRPDSSFVSADMDIDYVRCYQAD